jgi:hypothetical protein
LPKLVSTLMLKRAEACAPARGVYAASPAAHFTASNYPEILFGDLS